MWRRAGIDGGLSGIDCAAALASPAARDADAEVLDELLAAAEAGALAGIKRRAESAE